MFSFSYQLFEQGGQDVVQSLVTDGGMELLKGFGGGFSDLLQGVTQSLPHRGDQGLREDQHLRRERQQVKTEVATLKVYTPTLIRFHITSMVVSPRQIFHLVRQ